MPIYEVNDGLKIEFEREPTPEDVDEAVANLGGQPGSQFLTRAKFDTEQEDNPLNFTQQLMMGFIADDDLRREYLNEEFGQQNITTTKDGALLVDGKRINPEGLDPSDFTRNLGYAFPIGLQVAGSIMGVPGGPAGMFGGGVAGAVTGEALRVGAGKAFGAPGEISDVGKALAGEAALATAGEAIGLGLPVVGKGIAKGAGKIGQRISSTAPAKVVSGAWKNAIKSLRKSKAGQRVEPAVIKFITGLQENVTEKIPKVGGWGRVTAEENLNPDKIFNLVDKRLFGSKRIPVTETGMKKMFINRFKELHNKLTSGKLSPSAYRTTIEQMTGLAETELDDVLKFSAKDLIVNNPEEYFARQSIKLVRGIEKSYDDALGELGKRMRAIEDKFPKTFVGKSGKRLTKTVNIQSMLDDTFEELSKVGVGKPERMLVEQGRVIKAGVRNISPDFQKVARLVKNEFSITEEQKASALRRIMGQLRKRNPNAQPEELLKAATKQLERGISEGDFFKHVRISDAMKVRRNLDAQLQRMVKSNTASDNSTRILTQFMNKFRNRIKDSIGVPEYREITLRMHKLLKSGELVKVGKDTFDKAAHRIVMNGKILEPFELERFGALFKEIGSNNPAFSPNAITRNIEKNALGVRLGKLNMARVRDNFIKAVNNDRMLTEAAEDTFEGRLAAADKRGLVALGEDIFQDAQRAIIGQHLRGGAPNLLRVQTIAGILAGGSLGFGAFGPVGGAVGSIGGLAITQPDVLGKLLALAQKRQAGQQVKRVAQSVGQKAVRTINQAKRTGGQVTPATITRALHLLSQNQNRQSSP